MFCIVALDPMFILKKPINYDPVFLIGISRIAILADYMFILHFPTHFLAVI